MAFLDKTGLQTLTNRLVQGDAIKVASIRGRTVENVIDNITRECGNVPTPLEYKIENGVSDFRVGQGRDVDVSGDVEKGYTEVELQGKTWQNLLSVKAVSTLPIEYSVIDLKLAYHLKPNTDYTLVYTVVKENKGPAEGYEEMDRLTPIITFTDDSKLYHGFQGFNSTKGIKRWKFNSPKMATKVEFWLSRLRDEAEVDNIILLEGDHTQTPLEELPQYFKGIQSSFEDGVVAVRSGEQEYTASIGEPLRSLPNGTSDEISNGKLIRRVGKVILDGSGSIGALEFRDETTKVHIYHEKNAKKNNNANLICDNILATTKCYSNDVEGIFGTSTGYYTVLRKTRLTTQDVDGFRQWLQANPTTVYYELETPIITPVDPIKFETQPLGSIEINSEIPPTSFHTVQLNRAAQIERGITEIAKLKNRVEILETMYDSHFLETAHKLELLGMDYELESEEF